MKTSPLILLCAFALPMLAGQVCLTIWTPGNVSIVQVTRVYTGNDPSPPCEFPNSFYNDILDFAAGRDYRLISSPTFSDDGSLPQDGEIMTNRVTDFFVGFGADIRFTNFNLELGGATARPVVIQNLGRWSIFSDHSILPYLGLPATFYNSATFRKAGGTGTSYVRIPFRDTGGAIEVTSGVLTFDDATFSDTVFVGSGTVRVTSGRFQNINNQSTNLELDGGVFTGDLTGRAFWNSGQLAGTSLQGGFKNYGTMIVGESGNTLLAENAVFINLGTLELRPQSVLLLADTTARISNSGLLHKIVGTGSNFVRDVPIYNSGIFRFTGTQGVSFVESRVYDGHGTIDVEDCTVNFVGIVNEFRETLFTGNGIARINASAFFQNINTQTVSLELAGGTFTGDLNGRVQWTSGQLAGRDIQGGFQNFGTLIVRETANTALAESAVLVNRGTVELLPDSVILMAGSAAKLVNYGTLHKIMGTGSNFVGDVPIINFSRFDISGTQAVSAVISRFFDSQGIINVMTGAVDFVHGNNEFHETLFTGAGTVRVSGGAYFQNISTQTMNLELAEGGGFAGNLYGRVLWSGGQLAGTANQGGFRNYGTLSVTNGGHTALAASAVFENFGVFEGTGRVIATNASFFNYGVIKPDILEIDGNLNQQNGGTVRIEIAGRQTNEVGRLTVTGTFSRNGTLEIALKNSFVPELGDQFHVISATSFAGNFSSLDLPRLPSGHFWRTDRLSAEGVLWISNLPTNHAVWQNTYFTGAEQADDNLSGLEADPDGDDVSNLFEYLFALSPRIPEGETTSMFLPHPLLFQTSTSERLAVRFTLPEPAAADAYYEIQVSDSIDSVNWATVATKSGNGPWTGSAQIQVSPPSSGRMEVTVKDIQVVNDSGQHFMRFRGALTQ